MLRFKSMKWNGIAKLIEECGELTCVLGKLIAYPNGNHPDEKYQSPLVIRLDDEIADVIAACEYFIERNKLDHEKFEFERNVRNRCSDLGTCQAFLMKNKNNILHDT